MECDRKGERRKVQLVAEKERYMKMTPRVSVSAIAGLRCNIPDSPVTLIYSLFISEEGSAARKKDRKKRKKEQRMRQTHMYEL